MGAHFDYDWSIHFPPSTSKFMEDFKAKNAAKIEEERLKIKSQKKEDIEAQSAGARPLSKRSRMRHEVLHQLRLKVRLLNFHCLLSDQLIFK